MKLCLVASLSIGVVAIATAGASVAATRTDTTAPFLERRSDHSGFGLRLMEHGQRHEDVADVVSQSGGSFLNPLRVYIGNKELGLGSRMYALRQATDDTITAGKQLVSGGGVARSGGSGSGGGSGGSAGGP